MSQHASYTIVDHTLMLVAWWELAVEMRVRQDPSMCAYTSGSSVCTADLTDIASSMMAGWVQSAELPAAAAAAVAAAAAGRRCV
jgi:hypothetical protein